MFVASNDLLIRALSIELLQIEQILWVVSDSDDGSGCGGVDG